MTSVLEGRVFARQQRFLSLPVDLQDDTTQFQAHAQQNKTSLFQIHHAALVKSVYSVKGKALVDAVIAWLQARDNNNAPSAPGAGAVAPVPAEAATTELSGAAPTTTTVLTVSAEVRERARQISEALVLTGFLTPYKDDERHLNAAPPEYYVRDSDLLIPVAPDVTELATTSVWRVADRAIAASVLKRKAGVLGQFTHGKDVYVVFTSETAYLFESDLARAPLAEIPGASTSVQFDSAHFHFGVRVTRESSADANEKKDTSELFNAGSKAAQDEFLNHWLNIGATYREAYNVNVESVQSIYELKDFDMSGQEVSMDAYKGKVLLIVNVSSKCGLTPTNYPELAELDRKYRDEGLAILAFPCNQFANQEPGTHDEIMEFVKQYNCEFPFFEKHDVNGADARPVFTYLKAKLPGSFGNFVKWNFTKFLVDRNGQPYKRYAPKDLPFSFEDDIVELLNKPAAAAESVPAVAELVKDAAPSRTEPAGGGALATAAPTGAAPVHASEPSTGKTASEPATAHVAPAAT